MRKLAVVVAAGILGSIGLAGCGSNSQSYGDGYGVGQDLAANAAGLSTTHRQIVVDCRHQWRLSGPAVDHEPPWVNGCVAGFLQVQATLGTSQH